MSSVVTASALDLLPPISLVELVDTAELLTRVDRKYVVSAEQLDVVLGALDGARVLEIDGRRSFGYASIYFDTPALDSYLGAVRRRPGRFKVRTRCYVDDGTCWLEVKLRTRTGRTVKHRTPHSGERCDLSADDRDSLARWSPLAAHAGSLQPVLTTAYTRSTISIAGCRTTIDRDVTMTDGHGAAGLGDWVIVETKSDGAPGPVDRALSAVGARPVRLSKFGVGMAALHPELPRNKWHRVVSRYVAG